MTFCRRKHLHFCKIHKRWRLKYHSWQVDCSTLFDRLLLSVEVERQPLYQSPKRNSEPDLVVDGERLRSPTKELPSSVSPATSEKSAEEPQESNDLSSAVSEEPLVSRPTKV
jgi:hypothetical protein